MFRYVTHVTFAILVWWLYSKFKSCHLWKTQWNSDSWNLTFSNKKIEFTMFWKHLKLIRQMWSCRFLVWVRRRWTTFLEESGAPWFFIPIIAVLNLLTWLLPLWILDAEFGRHHQDDVRHICVANRNPNYYKAWFPTIAKRGGGVDPTKNHWSPWPASSSLRAKPWVSSP